MFGLTFEKLLVVMLLAAVVLGPSRLPVYAHQLARTIRAFRDLVEKTRSTAEDELGVSLDPASWESLDLQQYDPRRIVREALHDDPAPRAPVPDPDVLAEAEHVRPGQKYLVTGSAAHPRRVLLDSLPEDDPRRIAARPRNGGVAESGAAGTDVIEQRGRVPHPTTVEPGVSS